MSPVETGSGQVFMDKPDGKLSKTPRLSSTPSRTLQFRGSALKIQFPIGMRVNVSGNTIRLSNLGSSDTEKSSELAFGSRTYLNYNQLTLLTGGNHVVTMSRRGLTDGSAAQSPTKE
jgi:hypothetical protein